MKLKSIAEVKNLSGKRVVVRVDFNVPLKKGEVANDYKLKRSLPTIQLLAKHGAKVILLSHLGRPAGYDKKYSLEPVGKKLAKLLGKKISCSFEKIKNLSDVQKLEKSTASMKPGSVLLLDNVRFLPGEEKNTRDVARALARLGDIFILDGFAVAHRDAASVSGIARYRPSYAGLLLHEEISVLSRVLVKPKRPLVVLLGGVKVETKIPVLKKLLSRADYILVGGGIASTYWWAQGKDVGSSIVGKEYKKLILRYCKKKKVILPIDVVVGDHKGKNTRLIATENLDSRMPGRAYGIYDIGPQSVQLFSRYIKKAQTLIWNGAFGMFEVHPYEYGTTAIAELFAARSKGKAFGVAGGGETVEILEQFDLMDDVDLVSTGGGAMLEFLSGKHLPGLKRLKKKLF